MTWHDYRNESSSDIYAQKVNGSGAVQWVANGVDICTATGNQVYPAITSDGAGGAIVTWYDARSGNYDVYAQRVTAAGDIAGAVVNASPPFSTTNCSTNKSIEFRYDASGFPEQVRGYEVTFSIDTNVVRVSDPDVDITEGTFLSSVGPTFFSVADEGGGSYKVSCTIIGGSSGATGVGDLFQVNLTPVAEGISDIAITNTKVRDINNSTVITREENGDIRVDCTPPTMEPIAEPQGRYYSTAPSFGNFGFDDDVNLDLADYRIDSGGWQSIFVDIDTTEYNADGFILPGFAGLSEGSHTVYFRVKDDAGNWNGEGVPNTYSWQFYVDRTAPTMEPIVETQGKYYKTAPSFSNFGFDDDKNLDRADHRIDSGGWQSIFVNIDASQYNADGFVLPGFAGLSEGLHTIYFRVKDDAGNWNGEGTPATYSWRFIKDTVAPAPPHDFLALPGHNKVHLTWMNPAGDTTFSQVEIRRVRWSDYPEYEGPAPSYPANQTQGSLVVQTSSEAYDNAVGAWQRDIYYYAAFAFDSAGNYSAFDSIAADRSTSYWLGDIDLTGTVEASDLVVFSGAFGTAEDEPGWTPESDFGPTDDDSRLGIPMPDDVVDFEDLMILAMNYGNVSPLGMPGLLAIESPTELEQLVSIRISAEQVVEASSGTAVVSVVIENDAASLKGLRLLLDYGAGNDLVRVERGALISESPESFLGTRPVEEGKVEIGIATLGIDRAFEGSGEIVRLVIQSGSSDPVRVHLEKVDLRNVRNESGQIEVVEEYDAPFVPSVTAILQNHPNPFNPVTTITYDVAASGNVTIQIFDVSGRLIVTLVDAQREVGRYTVEWNGKSADGTAVPTGLYFYRMKALGYASSAKKMLLLK
ncbi:MAG: T9SS type A sorting domain-containing protein [Candidatus Eisenbacteria bacterium]|nr:T9SS type A sorting domain-containing protein [Candidatus Eisenbacteria bacterium]